MDPSPENAKYVILRGKKLGNKFFSINHPTKDQTKLVNGEIAYEIIGYADSTGEAQKKLYGYVSPSHTPSHTPSHIKCPFEEDFENRMCHLCNRKSKCLLNCLLNNA